MVYANSDSNWGHFRKRTATKYELDFPTVSLIGNFREGLDKGMFTTSNSTHPLIPSSATRTPMNTIISTQRSTVVSAEQEMMNRKPKRRDYYLDVCWRAPVQDFGSNSLSDICRHAGNVHDVFVSLAPTTAAFVDRLLRLGHYICSSVRFYDCDGKQSA
jgi:hypothetical protein